MVREKTTVGVSRCRNVDQPEVLPDLTRQDNSIEAGLQFFPSYGLAVARLRQIVVVCVVETMLKHVVHERSQLFDEPRQVFCKIAHEAMLRDRAAFPKSAKLL